MNLSNMTAAELRKLAAQHKIAGRSTMKKAELIDALSAPEIANLVELTVTVNEMDETPAPAPASDHNPDTDGRASAVDLSALPILVDTKPQHVYSVPVQGVRVEMERNAPGRALAEISTNEAGISRSVTVVKHGRVWKLVDHKGGILFVVKARTLQKLAKTWARKLGLWADDIRVIREF